MKKKVHAVELTKTEVKTPSDDHTGAFESYQLSANLLVTRPRRKVVLDETQNGRVERVQKVAEAVKRFLNL